MFQILLEPDYTPYFVDIRDTLADFGLIVASMIIGLGLVLGFFVGQQR